MEGRLPTTQDLHFWITPWHGWAQWEPTLRMECGWAVGVLLLPAPGGGGGAPPRADRSSSLCVRRAFFPWGRAAWQFISFLWLPPPQDASEPPFLSPLRAPSPTYLSLGVQQARVDVVPGAPAALVLPDQHRGRAVCHPSLSGPDLGRQTPLALAQLSHHGRPEPTQSLASGTRSALGACEGVGGGVGAEVQSPNS